MQARACRSCGVMVYDLPHIKSGKPAPIEVQQSDQGNILITPDSKYLIIGKVNRADYGPLHLNHFVTCPQAPQWSRKP